MEREKEIEEMKNEIISIPCKADCPPYDGQITPCMKCAIAFLVDKGYRKIPDGAVVLTKEQQEAMDKTMHAIYVMGQSNGRKGTAREIYLDMVAEFSPSARASGKTNIFVQMLLLLKKICNKHGAEIPESVEVE